LISADWFFNGSVLSSTNDHFIDLANLQGEVHANMISDMDNNVRIDSLFKLAGARSVLGGIATHGRID
jgi:hypothetical protein